MKLSTTELKVVRAALLLAIHGDDSAWTALNSNEEDIASDLLDSIPDPMDLGEDDDEEDEDDDY